MIKIGNAELKTAKPKDLDDRLIATVGINATEMAQQLRGHPRPQIVAQALRPFLGDDAAAMPVLASAVAAEDVAALQAQVLALYEKAEPEAVQAAATSGGQ